MPDRDALTATCERYVELLAEGDIDGIVALYAADATVEDPVGSDLRIGIEAVEAFYRETIPPEGVPAVSTGGVRVAGDEAAFPFEVRYGDDFVLPIIDVMRFRADGRISSMRAFWSMP